jgi:sortase A
MDDNEAPTEYIPRITDSPAEAPTELIPRVVSTPPPANRPRPSGNRPPANQPPRNRSSRSSSRAAARAVRATQRKLLVLSGIGEVLITLGAIMALYVVYTLWWTNVEAHKAATDEAHRIQQQFQLPNSPAGAQPKSAFAPSEGFALMTIPAIGKADVPVMQGVDKEKVLDKGAVGHYTTPATAMPWDPTGNFAVAAHRRTYGEPFRYINQLRVGDHVVVETTHGWFVYALDKELPQTDPSNVGTIAPIPKGGPFTKPGRYITLTTCTPEWASTYRLIWWGHLVRVDPLNGPPPPELKDPNRHS